MVAGEYDSSLRRKKRSADPRLAFPAKRDQGSLGMTVLSTVSLGTSGYGACAASLVLTETQICKSLHQRRLLIEFLESEAERSRPVPACRGGICLHNQMCL